MPDPQAAIRPLRDDEYDTFVARGTAFYVNDMVGAGVDPELARAKASLGYRETAIHMENRV